MNLRPPNHIQRLTPVLTEGDVYKRQAMALAKLCFDTLMEEGVKAKIALEAGACTKSVEKVIEANTLLSGIGFESGGLAGAHAIHNGFTVLEECHSMYHGEKVAFGTITQLVLEDVPAEELQEIIDFCIELGLPVTLKQLGVKEVTNDKIMAVAKAACAENDTLHNMPFEDVYKRQLHEQSVRAQHIEVGLFRPFILHRRIPQFLGRGSAVNIFVFTDLGQLLLLSLIHI